MWEHSAIRANVEVLRQRGVTIIGPEVGDMACNEYGMGRMSEPLQIIAALENFFSLDLPLAGRHALVTSGPTYEAIDPVRYIANRSSGKQGHAVAKALANLGARTTLVSGPTDLSHPLGVDVVTVESAKEMMAACEAALPADIAVCAAAVCDWYVEEKSSEKLKKNGRGDVPALLLAETPDILATISAARTKRPKLVVGFAAETENVIDNAKIKLSTKGCDWIIANDVSMISGVLSGDENTVHLITETESEDWPTLSKWEVGERLARRIALSLSDGSGSGSVGS